MSARSSRRYATTAQKLTAIRPANDSRPGSDKAASTARERASRAREEIVRFKTQKRTKAA